jgi:uncharacterized membrane protein YeiB
MTILNTTTVDIVTGIEDYFSWSVGCWFGIILTIACVIGFTFFLIETIKEKEIGFLGMGILCLVVGAVILAEMVLPHKVITTVNQYEVTVNDTISFKEITSKYDIIEQRGDIYVLREKLPEGVAEIKDNG